MPSIVGLLEERELTARRRVDALREEADRIDAELAVAEQEWSEWVIARSRVGEVLARDDDNADGPDACDDLRDPGEQQARPEPAESAKAKSVVPMWHAGLGWSAL